MEGLPRGGQWMRPYFVTLALAAALLATPACSARTDLPPDLDEIRRREPLSEAFDFTYLQSDSGRLRAKLVAPHDLEIYDPQRGEPMHTFDRGLDLEFYDRYGSRQTHITAKTGKLWKKSGIAEARGNVRLINDRGEILESEKLTWDRARKLIYTDQAVKITTLKEVIYGTGLESDLQFRNYKVFKTRGIINLKS